MALAIDASTPAVKVNAVSATTTVTTNSFTPPAGSLLLVLWACNSAGGVSPITPGITDSLGAHLTYTLLDWQSRANSPTVDGQAACWWAVVGSSAAMTVTVTAGVGGAGNEAALQVVVLTGQHATPIGAHGKSGSASAATIAQSYTASATSGWGFLGVADWNATGTQTGGTGCTIIASGNAGVGQISYAFARRTLADDSIGGSNTLRTTLGSTSTALNWVYAEVVPAAAAATVDPGPLLGNGPAGFTPFRPGPPVIRWDPSGAAATQVTVDTGTAVLGAATSVTAVKVSAVTAVASGGFGTTAAARKAAPATCRAPIGVTATATARKAAAATATTPAGLAHAATGVKVSRPALTSAAGLLGSAGASKRSTPSLTGPLGMSTTGTARKVTPSTGVDVVGLAGWVVRLPGRIVSATVPLGVVATVTAVKVSTPALRATAGLASAGSVRKVSRPALTAASGLAGTAAAVKVSRPLLLGTAGIAAWAVHTAAGSQAATGTNSLGLVATVTTRRVTPAAARAQVGFAGAATARHVGKATAVTPVALSAWWAVTAPTSRAQVDALDRPTSSVAALNRSAGSVDALDRTASRVGGG